MHCGVCDSVSGAQCKVVACSESVIWQLASLHLPHESQHVEIEPFISVGVLYEHVHVLMNW
jgi:hypothetical protein